MGIDSWMGGKEGEWWEKENKERKNIISSYKLVMASSTNAHSKQNR
jgi:hypothetical protein